MINFIIIRTDTESTGHYSRTEVDIGKNGGRTRTKISFPQLFKRKKDKVTGTDTDTVRTIVTMEDEKVRKNLLYIQYSWNTIFGYYFYF
jgi:hypothetical protein